MPLPRRVDELDMDGYAVSPVAYEPPSRPRNAQHVWRGQYNRQSANIRADNGAFDWRRGWGGCLIRAFSPRYLGSLVFALIGGSGLLFLVLFHCAHIAKCGRILKPRASQFETTRILDRNGNLLYEILDPTRDVAPM